MGGMKESANIPTTHITSAQKAGAPLEHSASYLQLKQMFAEGGAFETLMRLVRAKKGESLMQNLHGMLPHDSVEFDELFGHHGLGGEFGNGIGNTLMRANEYMREDPPAVIAKYRSGLPRYADDNGAQLGKHLEEIRACWRDKPSKATEYTDQLETDGAAMKRIGRDIRAFVGKAFAAKKHAAVELLGNSAEGSDLYDVLKAQYDDIQQQYTTVTQQLNDYDAAMDAIESLVCEIEKLGLPKREKPGATPLR